MNKVNQNITVFEHETLRYDKGEKRITKDQFHELEKYFGNGVPYFSLRYNGVQFNEYVGVIQIGKTVIEVLPKADKNDVDDDKWRRILIGMLKAVGTFDIRSTSNSNLKIKPNTVLDLYFEMFIKEVEYLIHQGLIKKYRKKQGNVNALKGSIQFGKHIQQNLIHQERFFVRYTTYDVEHIFHFIIYKAILLLKQINTNVDLHSRIGALLLYFPEMPDMKITESTFSKLIYNRKTQPYKKAIDIAKLLLLQYHPDVSRGRNNVLALMFDMNKLWEHFVYVSLRQYKNANAIITAQTSKYFWKPAYGYRSKMRPDILITNNNARVVLDTKWKNLNGYNPSPDDLRQMYVYHEYYDASRVALIYPGVNEYPIKGRYLSPHNNNEEVNKECSVILIDIPKDSDNKSLIKTWQQKIHSKIDSWVNQKS
ncbi:MAG: restriction endonuclease [Bacteroidota bacterium]|nr:restriction endonuclease [Bacteroidota bacterium]